MNQVTRILSAIEQGDPLAAEKLLPLVYDELRKLAAKKLAHETPGQTLEATALVHEAYLRLVDGEKIKRWHGRGHFFAAAAEAMRHILVDNARRKRRTKHGGHRQRIKLNESLPAHPTNSDQVLALDEALRQLAGQDPEAAAIVKLRYFAGLSVEDAAQAVGISRAGAYRHWTFARAWLMEELSGKNQGKDLGDSSPGLRP
jgi:RNA polymerase sigma factor (TIGR02999 family)